MVKKLRFLFLAMVITVLGTFQLLSQTVEAGISATGNVLTISAKPGSTFSGNYSAGNISIRWLTSYGVTLGATTNTLGSWAADPTATNQTSGSYTFTTFNFVAGGAIPLSWTGGNSYTLFTVPVNQTGTGTGTFELTPTSFSAATGWYFEVGGSDYTDYGTNYYASSTASVPLPVEITNCTAVTSRLNTTINWTTATETNNFGFNVERKLVVGSDWTKVGFVSGKGTSTTPTQYSFVDEGVAPGTYNYRLQQVDKSGSSKYSSVMTVDVGSAAKAFTLADNYPNPFNPTTNIEFTLPSDGHVTLKVYNTVGQEVATLFDGQGQAGRYIQARFDATRLASGIYFARLQYGGKSLMKKMLLVK